MGKQYNKLIKRRRRNSYLSRKRERTALAGKVGSAKKSTASAPKKKAAVKKAAKKKVAAKAETAVPAEESTPSTDTAES